MIPEYIPRTNLSPNDRAAIKAEVTMNPTLWPHQLAARWDISIDLAKKYLSKAQEQYSAKSLIQNPA